MRRPTALAATVVALVVVALLLGVQPDNLHNGLLAVSLAVVGAFVLGRRPEDREARLFVLAGVAEAVVFAGRQVGGARGVPGPEALAQWVAWVGIWPLSLVLVLVGTVVMCFPDGRLPGRAWRLAAAVMGLVAGVLSLTSALWPVDYGRAGLLVDHPLDLPGADAATGFFELAQPLCYTAFQVLWLACVLTRYAAAPAEVRRQLRWLVGAVALSLVVLAVGLATTGSPRAGLLTIALVPLAAGAAILEATYESLARRVVSAQDEARRRIERDLHDGAQHRLVVLGMELGRMADRAAATGDEELVGSAAAAREQLLAATAELRDLARGIHPAVLTQDGLPAALAALADDSPLPVRLRVDVPRRCPPEHEATVWFTVSEALTNAARHSGAREVEVRVRADPLRVEVRDDGHGGAVLSGGLQGLADRVASLGGRLELRSPAGGGTRLSVELP